MARVNRIGCVVACLPVVWSVPALARGGKDPAVGTWRGVHAGKSNTYCHEIVIVKRGGGYLATDITCGRMGLSEARALIKGRRPRLWLQGTSWAPLAIVQYHAVRKQGETLIFRNVKVTRIKASGKYHPDSYKCTLDPDGYLYGPSADTAGNEGFIWLERVAPPAGKKPMDIAKGGTASVTCWVNPDYHFKVRLPGSFDPAVPTPVIVYHSPGGNASPPGPEVADRLGWVSVGLTESKNGPWKPVITNRGAALFHLAARMTVHPRRVYFAGFSGGSRASFKACFERQDSCAGVIGVGAGLPGTDTVLWGEPSFHITGETDMNNDEARKLFKHLVSHGMETEILIHPGGHTSGRKEDMARAMLWMEYEWFSGSEPLEPTDRRRLEAVAKELLSKAVDAAAADRREACYWLSRMGANRKKELSKELRAELAKLASDPVYKQEAQAGAIIRRFSGKRIDGSTLKAIRSRYPGTTIAKRLAAMDW